MQDSTATSSKKFKAALETSVLTKSGLSPQNHEQDLSSPRHTQRIFDASTRVGLHKKEKANGRGNLSERAEQRSLIED